MAANLTASQVTRLLCFSVAGSDCALPLSAVREVIAFQPPRTLPQSAKGLLGVVNLRGDVIPVVDLATRMHLPVAKPGPEAAILIVSHGDRRVGLVVERMEAVLPVGAGDWSDPPGFSGVSKSPCYERIAKVAERMILVLSLPSLLDELPIQGLEKTTV